MASRGRSRGRDATGSCPVDPQLQNPFHPSAAPSSCVAPPALCPPGTHRAPPAWSGSPFTTSSSQCWELVAQLKGECTLSPTLVWPTCESCGAPSTSGSQIYLLPQPTKEPGTLPLLAATVLGTLSRGEDCRGRSPCARKSCRLCWDPGAGTQGIYWAQPLNYEGTRCSKKAHRADCPAREEAEGPAHHPALIWIWEVCRALARRWK